ncbi:MAG: response regulator [Rhizobiales bacterium]|nr:response regulator [Hyphomicrobiales bacterium]
MSHISFTTTLPLETYRQLGVLVVEDSPHMASMLRIILNELGVTRIWSARSGEDALGVFSRHSVDISVIDELEPPLDGLSIVRAIRMAETDDLQRVPAIYLTTQRSREEIIAARDAGVTEILSKPFSAAQFVARLETVLKRPRPIIKSENFIGPDRRRREQGATDERRKG